MFLKTAKLIIFGLLILLAIFSLFPFLPPFKGFYKIRAVMSGSMEKAVPQGSLIINQWTEDKNLKIGDIITYRRPDVKDFFITHRIKAVEKDGLFYFFKTQGDQVSEPDKWRLGQSLIEGKVIFTIPLLGYFYVFVQSPLGFFLFIFLPAIWIIFEEIKNIKKELERKKTSSLAKVVLLFLLASFFSRILPTYAYLASDPALMTGIDLSVAGQSCDSGFPSLEILADYQKQANFNLNFSTCDDLAQIQEVRLYYSRDLYGSWVYFASQFPVSNPASGSFSFNSPEGDGYYRFLSVAIDEAGNTEYDLDGLDSLPANTWTVVDTAAPITALSINQPMAVANEQIYNGGFENGNLDSWTPAGVGDHQATQAATKTGSWSALLGNAASDSLSKNLTLAPDITSTLSFWYRLLTDDVVSAGFFDARIKNGTEEIKVVHDGWDDVTIEETDLGWKNVVYQLNNLVGQSVDLQFKVTQPYDGYQTRAYLDEVRVTAASNLTTTETDINLSSHDASGSGVAGILYQIDGGIVATYSAALALGAGTHVLTYFAQDEAGNKEATKSMTINATESAGVDFGVVLNEFSPNEKWVELYNNSVNAIDINDWKIKNSAGIELAVISGSISSQEKLKIENVEMNEAGDSLILLKPDETKMDSFTYTFSTPGKSFKREPDGTGTWKDPAVTIESDEIASLSEVIIPELIATSSATSSATPEN